MAKRNFIPLVPSGTINADASVAQLEQDVLAMDAKVGELAEDIGDTEQEINQLKSQIENLGDTYAKIDGSYDTMTVGNAKQLVSTVGVEDKVPYLFRTTGGSADVGDRKTMEIVGGTIAWNQLMQNGNFESGRGWGNARGTTSVADNVLTYTVTELGGDGLNNRITHALSIPANHKALMLCEVKAEKAFRVYMALGGPVAKEFILTYGLSVNAWNRLGTIGFSTGDTTEGRLGCPSTYGDMAVGDVIQFRNVQYIDLTQMFGSTIADYIYSLEQANTGDGVAWFRKLFPKPYYAYNAGELMSVKTSANVTTGFNQWDEEWEVGTIGNTGQNYVSNDRIRSKNYIHVIPNTTYYIAIGNGSYYMYLWGYDADKNYVGRVPDLQLQRGIVTMPNWCHYIRFAVHPNYGTTYKNDICINLSWDGERDGEYEPYVKHEYPLDSSLTLRGIPKLSADNTLYYDGDTYEADGTVTRKYGIRVLNGTEDWHSPDSSGYCWCQDDSIMRSNKAGVPYSEMMISTVKVANSSYNIGTVTEPVVSAWGGTTASDDNYWYFAAPNVEDTPTAIKEYLAANPVTIVYMLTTPTEETADPYQTPQIVDDFGTEEFVDTRDVPIPVGHNTMYQANLRAKLEMAPDSPSGDGDYIVRQTNGQNSYVPITFPADELPAAPTTDGTYVLTVTVADGEPTFTWEAQS